MTTSTSNGRSLDIAFFGSSLVSAYWNGAATYYRGILRALAQRGHRVTFYEPDVFDRQKHRDIEDPSWAKVVVYSGTDEREAARMVEVAAETADVLVKASGVGVFDALLEQAVLGNRKPKTSVIYWDVDAPATLFRLGNDLADPLRSLIPNYDFVFTYGGGDPVARGFHALGARRCISIYNALDPEVHFRVGPSPKFSASLALLANRLPDREERVEEFFFEAARDRKRSLFLLGGNGWTDKAVPPNVAYLGHVYTPDHNAFNSTPLAVLNVARDSMARCGFSPAARIFEAAGAAACIITDAWEGIELFLEPGREVLVAENGAAVAKLIAELTPARAHVVGQAARARVLAHHTYAMRAKEVESILIPDAPPMPELLQ